MKSKYIAIGLLMLIGGVGCTHEFDNHKNTPSENFEALWQIIDEKYCLFDDKQVDWDSVYAVYQPQFDTMYEGYPPTSPRRYARRDVAARWPSRPLFTNKNLTMRIVRIVLSIWRQERP